MGLNEMWAGKMKSRLFVFGRPAVLICNEWGCSRGVCIQGGGHHSCCPK